VSAVVRAVSVSDAPFWMWWLAPIGATALAAVVVAFTRRERRGPDRPDDSIEDYERFRRALAGVRQGRAPRGRR
jgi:membrane protein implicated in regulation of membrane protease activity